MQPPYTFVGWMWEHYSWSQLYHPAASTGAEEPVEWCRAHRPSMGRLRAEMHWREEGRGSYSRLPWDQSGQSLLPTWPLVTEGRVGFLTRLPVPPPKEFPAARVKPDAPCALQLRVHAHSPAWQASSQEEGLEGRAETEGCWPCSSLPRRNTHMLAQDAAWCQRERERVWQLSRTSILGVRPPRPPKVWGTRRHEHAEVSARDETVWEGTVVSPSPSPSP